MSEKTKVFIAGSKGMVGSAVVRELNKFNQYELLTKSRSELDLMNQEGVNAFFEKEKIDMVVLAAARVVGIRGNINYPARFYLKTCKYKII